MEERKSSANDRRKSTRSARTLIRRDAHAIKALGNGAYEWVDRSDEVIADETHPPVSPYIRPTGFPMAGYFAMPLGTSSVY